jgi:hypothetical protein
VFDDPALDDGSGVLVPPPLDGALAMGDTGDGLVLQFPVEIEVRLVAAFDPEQLVSTALDRLTAALQGLA